MILTLNLVFSTTNLKIKVINMMTLNLVFNSMTFIILFTEASFLKCSMYKYVLGCLLTKDFL